MENKGNILMKKYDFGKLLGQGNFAKVYHGRDLKSGQSVAIKVIDKEKVSKVGMIDQTKREISAMGLVKHPNIVQLHEVMATKTKIYLVLEYAKGGELFDKVANGRLEEDAARKYFQQLIRAVDFCHSHGVYHRDLKPENLLLDENENLKVTDFGLSALASCTRQDGLLHTTCGTPAYVAPEVLTRKGYDGAKADVWSCGVILYVLLAGYLPFNDSNAVQMYRKMTKSNFKCPNWFPPETRKLLKRILDPNPDSRISTKKIMGNSWFRKGLITKSTMEKATIHETPFEPEKPDFTKVSSFNAFDIISLSTGFDLSGLFVENDEKDVLKFTSTKPADAIVLKMEQIAARLKMEVGVKKGGELRLVRKIVGRNGPLSMDVEVFEIASGFYFVEVRKSCGDALVYREMLKREIRPALEEIVLAWHGEQVN